MIEVQADLVLLEGTIKGADPGVLYQHAGAPAGEAAALEERPSGGGEAHAVSAAHEVNVIDPRDPLVWERHADGAGKNGASTLLGAIEIDIPGDGDAAVVGHRGQMDLHGVPSAPCDLI